MPGGPVVANGDDGVDLMNERELLVEALAYADQVVKASTPSVSGLLELSNEPFTRPVDIAVKALDRLADAARVALEADEEFEPLGLS